MSNQQNQTQPQPQPARPAQANLSATPQHKAPVTPAGAVGGTTIAGQTIEGVSYSGAELDRALKSGATNYSGCTLVSPRFCGMTLEGFSFINCKMVEADFRNVMGVGVDFSGSDLSGADFSDASLAKANLSRCNLTGANLSGANLRFTTVDGTDFTRANLSGAMRGKTEPKITGWDSSTGTLKKAAN